MEYLENLKNLKIKDLKEICDKYKLPKYGNKATLIERVTKKIENIEINKRRYQEVRNKVMDFDMYYLQLQNQYSRQPNMMHQLLG